MRKLACFAVVFFAHMFLDRYSSGQQSSSPAWLNIVISAPIAPNRSIGGFIGLSTASFLNDTCQPATLDGIQVLSVQTGHNEVFHLHVYCRQDRASTSHYLVTMIPVPNHKVDETAKALILRSNIRLGPLYLGSTGESDAIVLIEKTQ